MLADGTPLLFVRPLQGTETSFTAARTRGHQLRLTVLDVTPAPGASPPSALRVTHPSSASGGSVTESLALAGSPATTPWLLLDDALRNSYGVVRFGIATDTPVIHLKVRAEIAHATDPATSTPVTAVTRECEITGDNLYHGHQMGLLIPGYAFHPYGMPEGFPTDLGAARLEATQFLEGWARLYLGAARTNGLEPWERPRRFIVTCDSLLGGDEASLEQLHMMAEAMATLGFNTVTPDHWGGLPVRVLNEVLAQHGLRSRSVPASWPDTTASMFDYDARDLEANARAAAARMLATDYYLERTSDVVDIKLWDEPGWYYPLAVDQVASSAVALESFHAFLRRHGRMPEDFGQTAWSGVVPLDVHRSGAPSEPRPSRALSMTDRRLFYWTMRYFPESAAYGFRLRREALERVFGRAVTFSVNCNNDSQWYRKYSPYAADHPNQQSMGGPDWLLGGRLRGFTPWTEDGVDDSQLVQQWSFYADLLRSAAMLGDGRFGSYTRGIIQGVREHDAAYRILSLVGAGAKIVDIYTFGPARSFADGWSECWSIYSVLAEALRLVGRGEPLLHPGQPERGNVALLVPGSSLCWDAFPEPYFGWHYPHEVARLHCALVHAGYQVDLVDEADLQDGALDARGYRALYATAPNVEAGVYPRIEAWVRGGGTLVVTPSALVADELDEPLPATGGRSLLDIVLGLGPRDRITHAEADPWRLPPGSHVVEVLDASFAGSGSFEVRGPLVSLNPITARVVATSGGQACITVNDHGLGAGVAYAYYPGLAYWLTGRRHCRFLPNGWGKRERDLVVQPLRRAGVSRSVFGNVECVEVRRLESDRGIALVVLDWTGDGAGTVQITLTRPGRLEKVTSVTAGPLRSWRAGDALHFELAMNGVDVVLIEP